MRTAGSVPTAATASRARRWIMPCREWQPVTTSLLVVVCSCSSAEAQVLTLDGVQVPEPYTLMTHSLFYVYSQEDAPDTLVGQPSVSFQGLQFQLSDSKAAGSYHHYQGLQVGVFPLDGLWNLLERDAFCSAKGRLRITPRNDATDGDVEGVHLHTVACGVAGSPALHETNYTVMNKTGISILIISNCGGLTNATITGRIALQNSFGYLPAHEYGTLHLYGWLSVIHVGINFLWLPLQIKELKNLLPVQRGVTVTSMTAMLEVVFTYAALKYANITGTRHSVLTMAFLLCDTLKYVFGGWLILYLTSGKGIGANSLEEKASMPFTSLLVTMLFAAQQCVWRMIMSHRSSVALTPGFVVANTLPGVVLFALFFWWALRKLNKLVETLVEQKQTSSVQVFTKLRRALAAGLCMSVAVSSLQILDMTSNDLSPSTWRYAWFAVDGASRMLFLVSLVGMMILWWPGESSRTFGYSLQATDEADTNDVDLEEEQRHDAHMSDDDPLDSPRGTNAVAPEPIGARRNEDEDLL